MGNDTKKNNQEQRQKTVDLTSQYVNEKAFQPTPLEGAAATFNEGQIGNANQANQLAFADYGNIMGGYKNMFGEITDKGPSSFSWDTVKADRPQELGEAYGYLREAMPGYRDFASTGGYSNQDVQELRARGINPIRSAYGGAMRDIDRARNLSGGAANYIAARSRAQRELPQQVADATTNVNAGLADAIRQGKLAGLAGMSGIGSTMGGLSSQEANRMLQANLANSSGRLQAAGMGEQSYQNWIGNRMGALGAQAGLYGTTPGMASMYGNQALQGMGLRGQLEANRNNLGLGLIDANLRSLDQSDQSQGQPWWKTALGVAGTAAPYIAMLSDRDAKEDISPAVATHKVREGFKKLNLHKWKYKGENTKHFGPMAQDFKKAFGVGDGKTINLVDAVGVMLAATKDMVEA